MPEERPLVGARELGNGKRRLHLRHHPVGGPCAGEGQDERAARDWEEDGAEGYDGLGADLRAARRSRGESLSAIARALRIRAAYLAAIECGEFDNLPGATYGAGFVRSYAAYLGFDPKETVDRFKCETEKNLAQTELSFPEPVDEARIPSGGLILGAAILGLAVYGGWYWMSEADRTDIAETPPVPPRLATLMEDGLPSLAPVSPAGGAATPAAMPAAIPAMGPAARSGRQAVEEAAPDPANSDIPAGTEEAALTSSPSAPVVEEDRPRAPGTAALKESAAATPNAGPAGARASTNTPRALSSAAGSPQAGPGGRPRETWPAQATDMAGRVEIRARDDAWVQVRGRNDAVILMRVLRAGEAYRVPDERGLLLTTGNAGALELFVDGKPAPALGPVGAILRGVALEPERLLAGRLEEGRAIR